MFGFQMVPDFGCLVFRSPLYSYCQGYVVNTSLFKTVKGSWLFCYETHRTRTSFKELAEVGFLLKVLKVWKRNGVPQSIRVNV